MESPLTGMFSAPPEERGTMQKISRALMGFSEGVAGRGPQFVNNVREQDRAMSQERTMAMVTDAMTVDGLLASNKPDQAMKLMNKRLNLINELGGDPTDTAEIMQLVAGGNVRQARGLIGDFLGQAEARGLIQRPQPEMVNAGQLTDSGQAIIRDARGNFVAQDVGGFRGEEQQASPAMQTLQARAREAGLRPGSPEYQQFMLRGGRDTAVDKPSAREAEITDFMNTYGMSRADAISALSERTVVDPTSGNLMVYNPASGQGRVAEMNVPDTTEDFRQPENRSEFEDLAFDPGKGTGFASSFIGAWNSTVGQLPFIPISTSRSEAAQNLRILERDAINALATSSRPAVVEQQRIIQALPQAMEWFENPDDARMKMTSFIDLMTQQYVDDKRYSSNLSNPRTLREESARRANEVERTVKRVLKPEASDEMFRSINRIESSVSDIQSLPDDQFMQLDPSSLDDVQLDIYIERLRNGGQ